MLIIHPFEESIKSQYSKREILFADKNVLPQFELSTLKAVQSVAGVKTICGDWFEALDSMKEKMCKIDFDIAIIGCGAYGFNLAAHVRRSGKKVVHLGGAAQILFGIKGKKWDNHPVISRLYNECWRYPLPDEIPENYQKVEKGCCWG